MSFRPLCLAPCEGEHFTFRLRSDALSRANIPKDSRLLACPTTAALDGDLVIAETPEGKFVRFLRHNGPGYCLDTRDPDVPPLILSSDAVNILGVVCAVLA